MIIDPHSAVGLAAARRSAQVRSGQPGYIGYLSCLCASGEIPPDAVRSAYGVHPALPDHLSDLMDRDEVMLKADNDMAAVQALLRAERR